jgi:thioredoxin-dependent peroxiredoxin
MVEIEGLGAIVCGVSVDGQERLAAFAARYRLPFLLLSDRGGTVAERYGSLLNLGLLKFARRNTFLVDPRGHIARRYLGAQPGKNAVEVIIDLKGLTRT